MQVVVDEALDEVVAVVMARVAAQGEGLSHLGACSDQGLGLQLLRRQPGIGQSLVDQDAARVRRAGLGRPVDVAMCVFFLCSGMAPWVTGSSLVVDGGGIA